MENIFLIIEIKLKTKIGEELRKEKILWLKIKEKKYLNKY